MPPSSLATSALPVSFQEHEDSKWGHLTAAVMVVGGGRLSDSLRQQLGACGWTVCLCGIALECICGEGTVGDKTGCFFGGWGGDLGGIMA